MGKLDEILLKEIKLKKLGVSEITIVAIKKEKYLSNLYYWDCFKSSYKNFKIWCFLLFFYFLSQIYILLKIFVDNILYLN